jgi:hypothetical protein
LLEIAPRSRQSLAQVRRMVMRCQFLETHGTRVLLDDLQHGTWGEILTQTLPPLRTARKIFPAVMPAAVGPRVDRCFHPGSVLHYSGPDRGSSTSQVRSQVLMGEPLPYTATAVLEDEMQNCSLIRKDRKRGPDVWLRRLQELE